MMPTATPRAPRVCLTGGIASGKSRVAQWFTDRGWVSICTDEIVHELYRPGQAVAASVEKEFGRGVMAADGSVDRARLGAIVFADAAKLARLNFLVHPAVREAWRGRVARAVAGGHPTMVVIPLAYEAKVVEEFDQVWVVACSPRVQLERLAARGLDPVATRRRLETQLPLQAKVDLADRVIWNDGPWEWTERQAGRIEKECARELSLS